MVANTAIRISLISRRSGRGWDSTALAPNSLQRSRILPNRCSNPAVDAAVNCVSTFNPAGPED